MAGRHVDLESSLVDGRYLQTAGPLLDREEYIPLEACPSISRYHFEVGWDEAGPWVRDCSRNGTSLNGVRLPALQKHSLRPDDELRASECVVRLTATAVVDSAWLWWNGGTVARLARAIREDRAYDRLPILADALEDAGCTDADMLSGFDARIPRRCWSTCGKGASPASGSSDGSPQRAAGKPAVLVAGNNESTEELKDACLDWREAHVLHGSVVRLGGVVFSSLHSSVFQQSPRVQDPDGSYAASRASTCFRRPRHSQ